MSFSLRLAKSELDRRPGAAEEPREVSNLVAFSRGLVIGFASAFVLFDFVLLQGATTHSVLRGIAHLFAGLIGR
ncbi:MAG TPA: hypothetical protein VF601_06150 [Beijerinckiaceae bacterium]|jgi:hypothetical protein